MGVVVQRLANMKGEGDGPLFTKADIARKLSITERYIDDLNILVAAPAKVRTAVLEGSIASTLAIQELRRDPKKAEERLMGAVTKAKAAGKTKATRKHVGSVKMQKVRSTVSIATGDSIKDVLKAMAANVRETVGHDDGDVLTTDGTLTVIIEVPAPEPAPKAKAAPKAKPAKAAKSKPAKAAAATAKKDAGKTAAPKKAPAAAEVTSSEEGEALTTPPPPTVPTVAGDDPDDI
jgi:hypothetical protein